MANEQIPVTPLPKAPSGNTDLAGLSRWARDVQRVGSFTLQRIISRLNSGAELSGSWEPGISADTVAGTASYTTRAGRWTLSGQEVTLWGEVELTNWTGSPSGNLRIHNVPFIHIDEEPGAVVNVLIHDGITLTADYHTVTGYIGTNSQLIKFYEWGSTQTAQLIQASAASTTTHLEVFARYRKRFDDVAELE